MTKSEINNTTQKLKSTSQKYNGIVAKIIQNKELQNAELIDTVVESMDRLIERAEKKLAE